MKKRQWKKRYKREILDRLKLIMCRYCDSKETCKHRVEKEKKEALHIKTYCLLSPNGRVPLRYKLNKAGIPIDRSIPGLTRRDK